MTWSGSVYWMTFDKCRMIPNACAGFTCQLLQLAKRLSISQAGLCTLIWPKSDFRELKVNQWRADVQTSKESLHRSSTYCAEIWLGRDSFLSFFLSLSLSLYLSPLRDILDSSSIETTISSSSKHAGTFYKAFAACKCTCTCNSSGGYEWHCIMCLADKLYTALHTVAHSPGKIRAHWMWLMALGLGNIIIER